MSGKYAGKPMQDSGVRSLMERLEKKTGIKVTPHMLRHYFANTRRKAGWKLELISQALGHRHIETTMKYLNITEEELMEASDAASTNPCMELIICYRRRRLCACNQITRY